MTDKRMLLQVATVWRNDRECQAVAAVDVHDNPEELGRLFLERVMAAMPEGCKIGKLQVIPLIPEHVASMFKELGLSTIEELAI